MTKGWREKDAFGGLRDYGETARAEHLSEAQNIRDRWLKWRWADGEFKVDPWVGPITRKTFRVDDNNKAVGSAKVDEIGATIRRDDITSMAADSRAQMQRVRQELARHFTVPIGDDL